MQNKLKSVIYDLQHNMFGGNIDLSLTYKNNCMLYYRNELDKIPKKMLEMQIINKKLIGNIYYVEIK